MNKTPSNLFKSLTTAALFVSALGISACGGGGGGSVSTGGKYYSHSQLAEEFVRRVNVDVWGYDISLVKSNTLQSDYIVVYDRDYGTYDAYYIGDYNVGENLSNYLRNYEYTFYYGLAPEGGNLYRDWQTGVLFEKVQAGPKNISKIKALRQDLAINKAAEKLRAEYGLSEEKALDTARFSYKLKNSPKGTYNVKDFDAFARELTGSSISEFQNDLKQGNSSSLQDRLEKAGEVTGMGPEGVNKLIKDIFVGEGQN
jgi:hypothetical protein